MIMVDFYASCKKITKICIKTFRFSILLIFDLPFDRWLLNHISYANLMYPLISRESIEWCPTCENVIHKDCLQV